jgi:hypothetical protein
VKSEESLRSMSDATLALSARVNIDEILGSSGTSAVLLTLIHRRAWRDCMKKPHERTKRLSMRRLMAAYTNASLLAHSLS